MGRADWSGILDTEAGTISTPQGKVYHSPDCLLLKAPLVPPPRHPLALKIAVGVACRCSQALEDSAPPLLLLQPQSPVTFAIRPHVSALADCSTVVLHFK